MKVHTCTYPQRMYGKKQGSYTFLFLYHLYTPPSLLKLWNTSPHTQNCLTHILTFMAFIDLKKKKQQQKKTNIKIVSLLHSFAT